MTKGSSEDSTDICADILKADYKPDSTMPTSAWRTEDLRWRIEMELRTPSIILSWPIVKLNFLGTKRSSRAKATKILLVLTSRGKCVRSAQAEAHYSLRKAI